MTFKSLLKDSESVELKIGLLCSSSEGGLLQISLLHAGAHLFFYNAERRLNGRGSSNKWHVNDAGRSEWAPSDAVYKSWAFFKTLPQPQKVRSPSCLITIRVYDFYKQTNHNSIQSWLFYFDSFRKA